MDSLFAKSLGRLGTENAFKMGSYIKKVEEEQGIKVIKCNIGEPDFPTPKVIKEEIEKQLDLDNTHYCDPQGILPLRETIAEHISLTRGIKVKPEQVVVFPGAKPSIGFTVQVYCDPGDEVIYPSPGFAIMESFIQYIGARPAPLHLKEEKNFSFEAEDLEALITPKTKLIFLNFPSNPTGGVATFKQLEAIAKVIMKKCSKDVRVYSDEIYEDIIFDGLTHASIASIPGMQEKTIISSGVSKSFSWTGGRVGWAVFPTKEEADIFKNFNINYFSCIPPYNQWGAVIALLSLECRKNIVEMVAKFQLRRDSVIAVLRKIEGISCTVPRGAFYVFPNIQGICDKLKIFKAYSLLPEDIKIKTSPSTLFQMFLLFEYGVATLDRKSFGQIGAESEHYLRLSIAAGRNSLSEALTRIGKAADDHRGFEDYLKSGKPLY